MSEKATDWKARALAAEAEATGLRAENQRIVADVTASMDDLVEAFTKGSKARSVPSPAARASRLWWCWA